MKHILRSLILGLALIGFVVGGAGTVLAESHDSSSSPACDALNDASDTAESHGQEGLDRANDENNCDFSRDPGPSPEPEE